jgi:hypothetical protein
MARTSLRLRQANGSPWPEWHYSSRGIELWRRSHHGRLGEAGKGWVSPRDLPAVNQVVSVTVDDPDAHHTRAKAAGAEITQELTDEDYGSRGYIARDVEGNYWCFGTYRPGIYW